MLATRTNSQAGQKRTPRVRKESKLEVAGSAFPQHAVLRLVDDWIVPALVEQFLRGRRNLPEAVRTEHNVGQS